MDKEIEGMDVAVGAGGSEGERRSSTLSTAQDDAAVAALAPGQRWSLSRKRDVVLRLMQGEPVEGYPGGSACPSTSWRSGANAGSPGSTLGCASATTIRSSASSLRRTGASAS